MAIRDLHTVNGAVNTSAVLPHAEQLQLRGSDQERLHRQALEATHRHFGRQVFVRGVLEVSNFCREDCAYCGMRRSNRALARFRSDPERMAQLVIEARPAWVTDLNIQTGEDPVAVREVVLPLLRLLRRHTSLGLSVCLGTLEDELYDDLREAGATIYIMKFEVADAGRYRQLTAPGTLEERLRHIRYLAGNGWTVSSGFIAGLPEERITDLVANLELAAQLPLSGCSVSPFIPGAETRLGDAQPGDLDTTLNCMALLRLQRPDWVIPAVSALNLAQPGFGYRRGLRAGANLVTVNLTPESVRGDYLLYTRERFIMTLDRVEAALNAEGREPSSVSLAEHYAAASRRSVRWEVAADSAAALVG